MGPARVWGAGGLGSALDKGAVTDGCEIGRGSGFVPEPEHDPRDREDILTVDATTLHCGERF